MPLGLATLALLASFRTVPASSQKDAPKAEPQKQESQKQELQKQEPQKQGDTRKDGRPFIKAPVGDPATLAQIRGWDGWKIGPIQGYDSFAGPVTTAVPPLAPVDPAATPYKLRVFVFTRTERPLSDGRVVRGSIEPDGVKRVRAAVENLRAIVRATTQGRVDLVPTVTVDEEPMDAARLETELPLRMNGGKFDAEDGVDRGPFSGAIVVAPENLGLGLASGTPYASLDFYASGGEEAGTGLEAAMLGLTVQTMVGRLRLDGVAASYTGAGEAPAKADWPNLGAWLRPQDLPLLRAGLDASAPALDAAAGAHAAPPLGPLTTGGLPYRGAQAFLEADPETKPGLEGSHGTVLRLRETGTVRRTRLRLPKVAIPADRRLGFWARVGGLDSFAVEWDRKEGGKSVRERTILGPVEVERGAEFALDGKWHRVVVAVPTGAEEIEIVAARANEARRELSFANLWLDDFEWTTDAATPIVAGSSAEAFERAKTAEGADLAPLLADSSPAVRLLALKRVGKGDGALEPTVVRLAATEIVGENARAAAAALARLGTPTAIAALRRGLTLGPAEATRQASAAALAATGDPAQITTVAILLGRTPWRSRLAAVEALGQYRQENAVRFRLSATLQEIPELRYAALLPATTENADERQKLLYAAINDPSDAIRAFAGDRLLDARDPSVRNEGLRGTADDSAWVRVLMQRSLARRANPELKAGVLKGLADPVGLVRAEALRALVALGAPESAEVATILDDPHPDVLVALNDLAKAGKITLPQATKARIAASQDARLKGEIPDGFRR